MTVRKHRLLAALFLGLAILGVGIVLGVLGSYVALRGEMESRYVELLNEANSRAARDR